MSKNVKTIMWEYLKANGFDGLYNADAGCGCLTNELMPCDGCYDYCQPGFKADCDCLECHGWVFKEKGQQSTECEKKEELTP